MSSFDFAGTKDRRGCTTQFVTAYRLEQDRLLQTILSRDWPAGMTVEPVAYVAKKLRLGDLSGNRFSVLVRGVEEGVLKHGGSETLRPEETPPGFCTVSAAGRALFAQCKNTFKALSDTGFVNYFGLQRFGTKNIRTYELGVALLQKDWEKTAYLILGLVEAGERIKYRVGFEHEDGTTQQAGESSLAPSEEPALKKQKLDEADKPALPPTTDKPPTEGLYLPENSFGFDYRDPKGTLFASHVSARNWKAALNLLPQGHMPRRLGADPHHVKLARELLEHLDQMKPFRESVEKTLDKRTVSLYYHSVQSLVWNVMTTRRIEKFGLQPVLGDLVLRKGVTSKELADCVAEEEEDKSRPDEQEESRGAEADKPSRRDSPFDTLSSLLETVTEQHIGDWREKKDPDLLSRIVLPQPGSEVQYPIYHSSGSGSLSQPLRFQQEYDDFLKNELEIPFGVQAFGGKGVRGVHLPGFYRPVLGKARNVEWSLIDLSGCENAKVFPLPSPLRAMRQAAAAAAALGKKTQQVDSTGESGSTTTSATVVGAPATQESSTTTAMLLAHSSTTPVLVQPSTDDPQRLLTTDATPGATTDDPQSPEQEPAFRELTSASAVEEFFMDPERKLGLKFSVDLESSCYVTMFAREIVEGAEE